MTRDAIGGRRGDDDRPIVFDNARVDRSVARPRRRRRGDRRRPADRRRRPGRAATARPAGAEVVDCRGAIVAPGLVDMRVFVGEPGAEHRETFASAGQAAAAGGVTTIVTMPDTDPVIDDVALVDFIGRRARDETAVRVHPMAALTKGLAGARDDRARPARRGRRGRLHRRPPHRHQRRGDAPGADLCPRLRRADHAPRRRPAPGRRRA